MLKSTFASNASWELLNDVEIYSERLDFSPNTSYIRHFVSNYMFDT